MGSDAGGTDWEGGKGAAADQRGVSTSAETTAARVAAFQLERQCREPCDVVSAGGVQVCRHTVGADESRRRDALAGHQCASVATGLAGFHHRSVLS